MVLNVNVLTRCARQPYPQGDLGVLPHKFLDFTCSEIDSDSIWTVISISELIKNNHMKIQV